MSKMDVFSRDDISGLFATHFSISPQQAPHISWAATLQWGKAVGRGPWLT